MKKITQRTTFYVAHWFLLLISASAFSADELASNLNSSIGASEISESTSSSQPSVELTTGTSKDAASMRFGSPTGFGNFSLTLSTPLNKNTGEGKLFNFDPFENSTSAKLNFQRNTFIEPEQLNASDIFALCAIYVEVFPGTTEEQCFSEQILDDVVSKLEAYANENSMSLDDLAAISYWQNLLSSSFLLYGITMEYGTKEFEYFDAGNLDKKSEDENPWSAGLYVTYAKPGKYLLTLEYEYQHSYKAGEDEIRCQQAADEGNAYIACDSAAGSAPVKNTNENLSVGLRKPFSMFGRKYAISPTVTYDFKDDDFNLAIPVYLFQNGSGQFTGGIKAQWTDSTGDTEYSIFVGKNFEFF